MSTETIKNLSSRQQMRNICSEFIASLVMRLAVFSLTQTQILQLRRTKSPRPLKKAQISKPKIKTKPLFYIKHITNSGHVPPKEVQTLPLNLRQLIPNVL
jgi:hypothetical protein